jgi:hypothetical protein
MSITHNEVQGEGDLAAILARYERERIATAWNVIGMLVGYSNICITVPRERCRHSRQIGRPFQLRCWRGPHGYVSNGHVEHGGTRGGELLFETFIAEPLLQESRYESQLEEAGIRISPGYIVTKLICPCDDVPQNGYDEVRFERGPGPT